MDYFPPPSSRFVILAKAGIHAECDGATGLSIPAYARMTALGSSAFGFRLSAFSFRQRYFNTHIQALSVKNDATMHISRVVALRSASPYACPRIG